MVFQYRLANWPDGLKQKGSSSVRIANGYQCLIRAELTMISSAHYARNYINRFCRRSRPTKLCCHCVNEGHRNTCPRSNCAKQVCWMYGLCYSVWLPKINKRSSSDTVQITAKLSEFFLARGYKCPSDALDCPLQWTFNTQMSYFEWIHSSHE